MVAEVFLPLMVLLLVIALLMQGIGSLNATTRREQLKTVEKAIMHATVQCYALEGFYPPSYQYLAENYGLQVDTEKYIIHYDAFATNLIPDIMVFPRD